MRRNSTNTVFSQRIRRLRMIVIGGWLALVVPAGYLVWHAQQQIKWEALFQNRALAESFVQRVDDQLKQWITREEGRAVSDFEFLRAATQGANVGYLQRSPLSTWPVSEAIPGFLGYFQVDDKGGFSSPLLPENEGLALEWGVSQMEMDQRRHWNTQLHDILSQNRLASKRTEPGSPSVAAISSGATPVALSTSNYQTNAPAPAARQSAEKEFYASEAYAQKGFDTLNQAVSRDKNALTRIDELKLDKQFEAVQKKSEAPFAEMKSKAAPPEQRALRKEQSVGFADTAMPEASLNEKPALGARPIKLFESEVDGYEFARLDSGHFVLFRKVWQGGRRWIQGALIEQTAFIEGVIKQNYAQTSLASMCDLVVAFQGNVLTLVSSEAQGRRYSSIAPEALEGTLLLQQGLALPLSELTMVFSLRQIPAGPGARVVMVASVVLLSALLGVFYLFYRLGMQQIRLAQQQQNFVSAVSHELKTPLTSIRMFSEMLREGWVTPDKQREYYTYISEESERLSRLIANVLQLARMERQDSTLDIKSTSLHALLDLVRSRCASQLERAGFELRIDVDEATRELSLSVDTDAFLQIMLNLIDNAVKFSTQAEKKQIEIGAESTSDRITVWVRDYGPGIPPEDLQRIFDLFYRIGNELTRETKGTGIGLSLVRQLAEAMGGQVSALNRQPGAEFRLQLVRQ